MKSFFTILFITLVFIYISGFHLKLKPFKISFDDLPNGLGYAFLVLSLVCFQYSSYKRGENSGYQKAVEDVDDLIKKMENQRTNTIEM